MGETRIPGYHGDETASALESIEGQLARVSERVRQVVGQLVRLVDVLEPIAALAVAKLRSATEVPRPGTVARAISYDGSPIGVVRVEESDPIGDAAGPWWSGTLWPTRERLVRLRACHYAGPAEPPAEPPSAPAEKT